MYNSQEKITKALKTLAEKLIRKHDKSLQGQTLNSVQTAYGLCTLQDWVTDEIDRITEYGFWEIEEDDQPELGVISGMVKDVIRIFNKP